MLKMHALLLLLLVGVADACLIKKVCSNVKQCKDLIADNQNCGVDWKEAACTVSELLKAPVFSSETVEATITTAGVASIHASFSESRGIKDFFKSFANAKAVLATAVSVGCSAPKEVQISVQLSGQSYDFADSLKEIAGAVTDDDVDGFWLEETTGDEKISVLSAATATASLTWNPFDAADKGKLIRLDAELTGNLLPPKDGLVRCQQLCEYLHSMLGATGKIMLSGGIDNDDDADFDDDDANLFVADDDDGDAWGNGTVKIFLKGEVDNAVIQLNDAGAELEDLGLIFRLEMPKKGSRRQRRNAVADRLASSDVGPAHGHTHVAADQDGDGEDEDEDDGEEDEGEEDWDERNGDVDSLESGRSFEHQLNVTRHGVLANLRAERARRGKDPCPIDLMILLDESNSIGSDDFGRMKDFLRDLVDELTVGTGPDDARVGLVKFSTCVKKNIEMDAGSDQINYPLSAAQLASRDERCPLAFKLSDHTSNFAVKAAISGLTYRAKMTQTKQGLEQLRRHLIPESFAMAAASTNGRTAPHRLVLVLTDGAFNGAGKKNVAPTRGSQKGILPFKKCESYDTTLNPCPEGATVYKRDGSSKNTMLPLDYRDPSEVAKEIVTVDGVPIMAIGVGMDSSKRWVMEELAYHHQSMVYPRVGETLEFGDLTDAVVGMIAIACAPPIVQSTTYTTTTTSTLTLAGATSATTTTTTTTTGADDKCGIDLTFVVDQSSSINDMCNQICGGSGPCGRMENNKIVEKCWPNCPGHLNCWNDMKSFIVESTKKFDVGTAADQTRVSLVTYGNEAFTKFDFDDHQSNAAVETAINQVEYDRCLTKDSSGDYLTTGPPERWCQRRANTHTLLGVEAAKDLFDSASSGVRPKADKVKRVVVIMTDGHPTTGYDPVALAKELEEDGVVVIAVGVNLDEIGLNKLSAISSLPHLSVAEFDELHTIVDDLVQLACPSKNLNGNANGGGVTTTVSSGTGTGTGTGSSTGGGTGSSTGGGTGSSGGGAAACSTNDGYLWSLAITATLKLAENEEPFSAEADQLTVNGDGTGVLLPGDAGAETAIDAVQLTKVTNNALRLRGEIGFRVKGKGVQCLKKSTGRFYFGLAKGEALMNAMGSPYVHFHELNIEMKWKLGSGFPFIRELTATGQSYIGAYGHAALCVLGEGACTAVLDVESKFTFKRNVKQDTNTFGLSTYLRPQGTSALADVYEAIAGRALPPKQRQWLALLSALDYSLTLGVTSGKQVSFSIELVGRLTADRLPAYSKDDLVDGDCNLVCQKLHDAFGSTPGGSAQVTAVVMWNKADGVSVDLSANIDDASIELKSNDGGAPAIDLTALSLSFSFAQKDNVFKAAIGAEVDVEDGIKVKAELGFGISDAPGRQRRGSSWDEAYYTNPTGGGIVSRRGTVVKAWFNANLREPIYGAFGSDIVSILAMKFELEISSGGGKGIGLDKLEATGELCLGDMDVCRACAEPASAVRSLMEECRGPIYAEIIIGIRIPGKASVVDPDALIAEEKCAMPSSGAGKWEFFIQATIEAVNGPGGGVLSRIQAAVAKEDASDDVDGRMNTFAAAKFVLKLTLGPSRVKLSVEAQLHKLSLPPNDNTAKSTTCDMICQMCHQLLENAAPGSYIFVKGEFGVTIKPFSLSVAIGAGFNGEIEYPDQGLTLTKTGITLIFSMDGAAVSFSARVYGSFIKEQTETFDKWDGIVPSGQVVKFIDPDTKQQYGQTTKAIMDGFTMPLMLDGAFELKLVVGRKGECAMPSTPGPPSVEAAIEFGMKGWSMKFFGKRVHIGNTNFKLAMTSTPPYFKSFAGGAEICLGTTGRCAKCVLGTTVADCARTIYLASYVGVGVGQSFVRLELYSLVSLFGFFETFDIDKQINLPNGINVIEFGPRAHQRAAVLSISGKRRVIDKGFDVKTQTYEGNEVVIPAGLMIDGRVTLFPDVSWLRFSAELVLIIGSERLLIDYTQSPISWGCDSSGSGCLFELTGYDHTPSVPQGPRFYINLVWKAKRTDVPDISTDDMFAATGKETLDDGCRRRERKGASPDDANAKVRAPRSECQTRFYRLDHKASVENIPKGAHRACLKAEYEGVFESKASWSHLEIDVSTMRATAHQGHKFMVQEKGKGYEGPHLLGEVRDCGQVVDGNNPVQGSATIDLRGTPFQITGMTSVKAKCEGPHKKAGSCKIGQWVMSGFSGEMTVQCAYNGQQCVVRCGGASARCSLATNYLQLTLINDNQQEYLETNLPSRDSFYSDTGTACAPKVQCCKSWCANTGLGAFWPIEQRESWDCCDSGGACCSMAGQFFVGACQTNKITFDVAKMIAQGGCDPRPYCMNSDTVTTTAAAATTTQATEAATFPITQDAWIEHSGIQGTREWLILGKEAGYQKKRVVVHADLSEVDGSSASVVKATLRLRFFRAYTAKDQATIISRVLSAHKLLLPWDERTVNTVNRKANTHWQQHNVPREDCRVSYEDFKSNPCVVEEKPISSTKFVGPSNMDGTSDSDEQPTARSSWMEWDVTAAVAAWVKDPTTNNGILLWALNEDIAGGDLRFASKEWDSTASVYNSKYTNAEFNEMCIESKCGVDCTTIRGCPYTRSVYGADKTVGPNIVVDFKATAQGSTTATIVTTTAATTVAKDSSTATTRTVTTRTTTTTITTQTPHTLGPTTSTKTTQATTATTTTVIGPGEGVMPNGTKCLCDCKVCDPPPKYTQLTGAAEGAQLLASVRVLKLQECERVCARNPNCKAFSFDKAKSKFKWGVFLGHCKTYAAFARRRRARAATDVLFFSKDDAEVVPYDYTQMTARDDQHHGGSTLVWKAVSTDNECKKACDQTVKCRGFSVYVGVSDDQNCRLVGDSMGLGPWTRATAGPWSSSWLQAGGSTCSTSGSPALANLYRWDESVGITSYTKNIGGEEPDLLGYVPSEHSSDEIFIGQTLRWLDAKHAPDAETCMEFCMEAAACTGISFYPAPVDGRINGMQCKLAAGSMDNDASWIRDGTDGGRQRRQGWKWKGKLTHLVKKLKEKVQLLKKDCTCKVPDDGSGYSGPGTGTGGTGTGTGGTGGTWTNQPTPPPPPPPGPTTTSTYTTATATTIFGQTTTSTTTSCNTLAILDEIQSCDGDPTQTCIVMHARTVLLGLEMRIKVQITKKMAAIDADGSLFGSFIKAAFGLRVALEKPRSFRMMGEIKMESKDEVMRKIKEKLQAKADESKRKFEQRRANVAAVGASWKTMIDGAQADVDRAQANLGSKADDFREKSKDMEEKRAKMKARKSELDKICKKKDCCKWCAGCHAANLACSLIRTPKAAALAAAQVYFWAAEKLWKVAAAATDALAKLLDVAKLALKGVQKAADAAILVAQKSLNAMEKLVGWCLKMAAKILEGAFNKFYLREFSFDFQLSKDSKYLKYYLDCTLFGKKIEVRSTLDFSSIGAAIKSLVMAIVDLVKAIFKKNRRSRGIESTRMEPPAVSQQPSPHWVSHVRRYANHHHRRDVSGSTAGAASAAMFETVCEGRCICRACIKSVKSFITALFNAIVKGKAGQTLIKKAGLIADSRNTASSREASAFATVTTFISEAKARRVEEKKGFGSVAEECATAENVTACTTITTVWDEELLTLEPDAAFANKVIEGMADYFNADDAIAKQYHAMAEQAEQSDWQATLSIMLLNETKAGIGCPAVECADAASCLEEVGNYILEHLEIMADSTLCENGKYESASGGCDKSEQLVHQEAAVLLEQWRELVPGLSALFGLPAGARTTLSDAFELVDKARAVVGSLAPADFCEGRVVLEDTSISADPTHQENSHLHTSEDEDREWDVGRRAFPPAVAVQNQLLDQFPTYSSICSGSGLGLTDGVFGSTAFETCVEDTVAFVEIPTAEPSIITTVRVGKKCDGEGLSDASVVGLQISIRTSAGIFDCGGVADVSDASCYTNNGPGNTVYWERACELNIPARSVRISKPADGAEGSSVALSGVQADGSPLSVSNVLLGQPASSTSQCHERPSFRQLGDKNSDQFPTMHGSRELSANSKSQCLQACQADDGCVAVSYFMPPFLSPGGNNCILLPNTVLGDGTVWVNAPVPGATKAADKATVVHFSKHVPYQRFEEFSNHVHDGELLKQACVPDLAECKARCTADVHCTGFTIYGDEDDELSASVCAMTGDNAATKESTRVFADGPFAQLPAEGISANLGRPPRLGESSDFTTAENYGIVLGLDKVTDGFYQPLAVEGTGTYSRQGFLHTCGETDNDQVVVPTTEPSRVYTVRVWKRCDCCKHRAIGLQVMQQVQVGEGPALEWRACGDASTAEDATCSMFGPEQQFFERTCDQTVATMAIKVVRVSTADNGSGEDWLDDDYRSLDIPEIEAFGAAYIVPPTALVDVPADNEIEELDPEEIMELHYATVVRSVPEGEDDGCGTDGAQQRQRQPTATAEVVYTEPLMVCTISTTTATTQATQVVDNSTVGDIEGDDEGEEVAESDDKGTNEEGSGDTSTDISAQKDGMSGGAVAAVVIVLLLLLAGAGAAYYYRDDLKQYHAQHFGQEDTSMSPKAIESYTNRAYAFPSDAAAPQAGDSYLVVGDSDKGAGSTNAAAAAENGGVASVPADGAAGSASVYEITDADAQANAPVYAVTDEVDDTAQPSGQPASPFTRKPSVYEGFNIDGNDGNGMTDSSL